MTLVQGVLSPPVAAAYAFDEVALVFALIWIDCDRRVRHWTRSVGHRGTGERWGRPSRKRRSDGGDEARATGATGGRGKIVGSLPLGFLFIRPERGKRFDFPWLERAKARRAEDDIAYSGPVVHDRRLT